MNYSNKGQEFPEVTKVLLLPVACGSTRCLPGSVKGPDPNCQLSGRRYRLKPSVLCSGWKRISEKMTVKSVQNLLPQLTSS